MLSLRGAAVGGDTRSGGFPAGARLATAAGCRTEAARESRTPPVPSAPDDAGRPGPLRCPCTPRRPARGMQAPQAERCGMRHLKRPALARLDQWLLYWGLILALAAAALGGGLGWAPELVPLP